MILERSNNLVAEAVHGENIGGVPSHEQMITSKIEEKSGDVVPIGWQHFYNVLFMLLGGAALGGLVTMLEKATFWIQSRSF